MDRLSLYEKACKKQELFMKKFGDKERTKRSDERVQDYRKTYEVVREYETKKGTKVGEHIRKKKGAQ